MGQRREQEMRKLIAGNWKMNGLRPTGWRWRATWSTAPGRGRSPATS